MKGGRPAGAAVRGGQEDRVADRSVAALQAVCLVGANHDLAVGTTRAFGRPRRAAVGRFVGGVARRIACKRRRARDSLGPLVEHHNPGLAAVGCLQQPVAIAEKALRRRGTRNAVGEVERVAVPARHPGGSAVGGGDDAPLVPHRKACRRRRAADGDEEIARHASRQCSPGQAAVI